MTLKSKSKKTNIISKILLVLVTLIFTLLVVEIGLRFYYFGGLSVMNKTPNRNFIGYDDQLGWSNIPYAEGYFSDPIEGFKGYVKFDQNGVRVNDNNFNTNGKSILIVGDSVTAGLEVDNNETYASVLERLFFENGCDYRVYNAGVRGYGTDQSLWNLEKLVQIIEPKYVIYMFESNDFLDNRTIKQSNREYGKPVFIMDRNKLTETNRPSKEFQTHHYCYVRYDDGGYEIHKGYINATLRSVMEFIKDNFALYFPLKVVYKQLQISPMAAVDKKAAYPDVEILELILKEMNRDDIDLFLTSFPYPGDEVYIEDLKRISDKISIEYLDIFPYFTEVPESYHWKNDGHWNEKGHFQGATGLYELLKDKICKK